MYWWIQSKDEIKCKIKCKVLIVFDDMITDIRSNKKPKRLQPVVTELFV